jgi:hypothetical protein
MPYMMMYDFSVSSVDGRLVGYYLCRNMTLVDLIVV